MSTPGFLGIDAGTQGLSVIFTDRQLNVLGVGEGSYEMLPGLESECYEQSPNDWIDALQAAMKDLRGKLAEQELDWAVEAIGISGQMHGEVLANENGEPVGSARLWCDSRNEDEGHELTQLLGVKMPKRATASRWLWTLRNQPEKAQQAQHMTTPAGWLAFCLTGQWNLGVGDAAGMFPIDQGTLSYDERLLDVYEGIDETKSFTPLRELLPTVKKAGEDAGQLDSRGSELLGLVEGIPVAAAEGDQPAALAGSLIGEAGMVSVSFGTSVCANSVGNHSFAGVSDAIDHFCAVDGKPINMVWLRNGTTYMNTVVEMFGRVLGSDDANGFEVVMPQVLDAAPDCGGITALPFMDDEPGLGVKRGGSAMLAGMNPGNATPGNTVKAALLSTMFNLRLGSNILDEQGFPRSHIVLSGGLTKTPQLGQILADVFDTTVSLLDSAEEGTAWGAALLASYRSSVINGSTATWAEFLVTIERGAPTEFHPVAGNVEQYRQGFDRYKSLVAIEPVLTHSLTGQL